MTRHSRVRQLIAEADRCVACGLCVPQCPSYKATGSEVDSPRGRIFIMRAMLEGSLAPDAGSSAALDRCLGCGQCEAVCPNKVGFGNLLHGSRKELSLRNPSRSARLTAWLAGGPSRVNAAGWAIRMANINPLRILAERLAPSLNIPRPSELDPLDPVWGTHTVPNAVGKVHVFVGCFARLFDGRTIRDAIGMVNACGYDAVVPRDQGCCGSLSRQLGDHAAADRLQGRNGKAFAGADRIVCSASGCLDGVGEHGTDIVSFIAEHGRDLRFKPSGETVLLHTPCTARNSRKGNPPVEEVLARVPDTKVITVESSKSCCGAAGSYHIHSPRIAKSLRDSMVEDILREAGENRPARLLTANYGCGMHLRAILERNMGEVRIRHPVSFLCKHL